MPLTAGTVSYFGTIYFMLMATNNQADIKIYPIIYCVNKCDCKIVWVWVRSPFDEIKYFFFFFLLNQSATLSSISQHAMPPEPSGKWATECLNTRFLFPYPAVCGIQREAELIYILCNILSHVKGCSVSGP